MKPRLFSRAKKFVRNTFLAGVFAAIPLVVTIFVLWYVDHLTREPVKAVVGIDVPFAGVGLALVGIFVLGILVRSLIGAARSFDLQVLAEGVERAEQAHFLMSNDCHNVQGFLFGRPVPARDLAAIISKDLRKAVADAGPVRAQPTAAAG